MSENGVHMIKKACRVAFVGGGSMTAEHAKAFSGLPGVELVGIHNRTLEKAEAIGKAHGIKKVYDSLEVMLETAKPDLVVLAVYETAILEIATRILRYPVALFMEKPMGLDLREARLLQSLAHDNGRSVWVGLNRRAFGSTRAALRDLDENPGPRFIHVQDQQSLETARVIGHAEPVVKNWMYANSIHLVDYLVTFGRGKIVSVDVLQPWRPDAPSVVVAHVTFSSGDAGIYQAIWNGPGPWACTVSAPHRRWELRPLEKAAFQNANERAINEVSPVAEDADYKPGFRQQAENVLRAWNGAESDAVTLDVALLTTELTARIYGLGAQD